MGAAGILAGAGAGAVLGLVAGPAGAALGAVLGGLAVAIRGGGIEARIAALSNEGLWVALCAAQNPGQLRPEVAARLVAELGVIPGPEHVALIGAEAERRGVNPKHDCAELLKPVIATELEELDVDLPTIEPTIKPTPSPAAVKKLRKMFAESEFLAFACNPPADADWSEAIADEAERRGIFGLTGRCAKLSGFSGLRARSVR